MRKLFLGLIIVLVCVSLAHAKTITVKVCDICDASLAEDNNYYSVEHVMACNNDPGTKDLCSVECLVAWAKESAEISTDSFDRGSSLNGAVWQGGTITFDAPGDNITILPTQPIGPDLDEMGYITLTPPESKEEPDGN
jgi:hypothetical protein